MQYIIITLWNIFNSNCFAPKFEFWIPTMSDSSAYSLRSRGEYPTEAFCNLSSIFWAPSNLQLPIALCDSSHQFCLYLLHSICLFHSFGSTDHFFYLRCVDNFDLRCEWQGSGFSPFPYFLLSSVSMPSSWCFSLFLSFPSDRSACSLATTSLPSPSPPPRDVVSVINSAQFLFKCLISGNCRIAL